MHALQDWILVKRELGVSSTWSIPNTLTGHVQSVGPGLRSDENEQIIPIEEPKVGDHVAYSTKGLHRTGGLDAVRVADIIATDVS